MRTAVPALFMIAWLAAPPAARAQDVLYRCETADGISIQGVPCPKGAAQRKISVPRTSAPVAAQPPAAAPASPTAAAASPTAPPAVPALAAPPAAKPGTHWVLVTNDDLMRGPNDPYLLWQCMRADGSTYDSRNGTPGKQWVPTVKPAEEETGPDAAPAPPKITSLPNGPILRPLEPTVSVADDTRKPDLGPPPPGAAPGQWVADQCQRLEPPQACERYAARRDALRKQIYASKPSERVNYAPEEQDLTRMLSTACGM